MQEQRHTENEAARRTSARRVHRHESQERLHQITFCEACEHAIPVKATACFHCGARQQNAEPAIQIVFCDKCGEDYLSKAMACYHCGHLNARHPLLNGAA